MNLSKNTRLIALAVVILLFSLVLLLALNRPKPYPNPEDVTYGLVPVTEPLVWKVAHPYWTTDPSYEATQEDIDMDMDIGDLRLPDNLALLAKEAREDPEALEALRATYCDGYRALVLDMLPDADLHAFCIKDTNYLMIYEGNHYAGNVYKQWVEEAAKVGHSLKEENRSLFVTVMDRKEVQISHYCTRWGSH